MLKKNDIEQNLKDNHLLDDETYFIWGTIGNDYFIISFCKIGICLLPITPMGKLSGEIHLLENKHIEILELKKKFFGYRLSIKPFDDEKLTLTIRPFMIGYKGQKESIEMIKRVYFSE